MGKSKNGGNSLRMAARSGKLDALDETVGVELKNISAYTAHAIQNVYAFIITHHYTRIFRNIERFFGIIFVTYLGHEIIALREWGAHINTAPVGWFIGQMPYDAALFTWVGFAIAYFLIRVAGALYQGSIQHEHVHDELIELTWTRLSFFALGIAFRTPDQDFFKASVIFILLVSFLWAVVMGALSIFTRTIHTLVSPFPNENKT